MIPLGIVSAAGAGETALPTKIFLTAQIQTRLYYPEYDFYANPVVSNYSVFPDSPGPTTVSIEYPNEVMQINLIATMTTGLDEEFYENPVVGESIYFNVGPDTYGTSSLDSASSQTMSTDSSGQVTKTFIDPQTWSVNGDNIQAIFDGNVDNNLLPSQSGIIVINITGAS